MRLLCPHLARSSIQVLALEKCELTDNSCEFLASIIKAQEAKLDNLYWNSTLRQNEATMPENTEIMSQGLVALSISGNKFEGKSILTLARVLKRNGWLLGLNMGNNMLSSEAIDTILDVIRTNSVINVVVFNGNPGVEAMKVEVDKYYLAHRSGNKLNWLPSNIAAVLRKWISETEKLLFGVESVEAPISGNESKRVAESTEFEQEYNLTSDSPSSYADFADVLEHGIPSSPLPQDYEDVMRSSSGEAFGDKRPPSRSGLRRDFNRFDLNNISETDNSYDLLVKTPYNSMKLNESSVPSSSNTLRRSQSAPIDKKMQARSKSSEVVTGKVASRVGARKVESSKTEDSKSKEKNTRMKSRSTQNSKINQSSSQQTGRASSQAFAASESAARAVVSKAKSPKSKSPKNEASTIDDLNKVMDKMIKVSHFLNNAAEKLNESINMQNSMMSSRQDLSFAQDHSRLNSSNVFDDFDRLHNRSMERRPESALSPQRASRQSLSESPARSSPKSGSKKSSPQKAEVAQSQFVSVDDSAELNIDDLIKDRLRSKLSQLLS